MSLAGVVALAALAAWMWVVGSALARGRPAAERVANGALAACVLAWMAMACGAFGIGILGSTAITVGVAVAAAAAALARRPPLRSPRPVLAPLVVGGAAGLLLAAPGLLRSLDALRPSRNDMVWHMAWVHQLSAGFSSPGGVYAGEPNSYPWLFHSLAAWIAAALPGGAVDAFQVLELFGLVCAGVGMWLLARELGACDPEATWSVGLFLTAAAFGLANRAAFQFEMPALELGPFHGDPVPATTPALAYLPPMIPRDLGLALAPIVLWLAMCAARGPERMWWRAGFAGGLVFLAAPPAGIFCALWVVTIAVVERRWGIWRAALAWVAATSVWLVPLAIAYHRYHGFVPIAQLRLTEPNTTQTLVAVGLSLPLGLVGLVLLARSRPQMATRAIVLVAIPAIAVLLGASISQLSTLVAHGVPTPLVRWLRYLPFLVLALCVPAGVAANALVTVLSRRARPLAIAAAVLVIVVVAGSTALASATVWREPAHSGLVCSRLPIDARTHLAVLGRAPVADYLGLTLFGRTGASLYVMGPRPAKVRFRTWLHDRVPDAGRRRSELAAALHGGPLPPGIDMVFVQKDAATSGLGPAVASCSWRGQTWELAPPATR
jgi:hypothetical protein